MLLRLRALALAAALVAAAAPAQEVVRNDEVLEATRTEAWAMGYVAASTLMTAFGEAPALAPWRWQAAVDLGHVPRLTESQQRVGLGGVKQEDLNRSPVFGRLRVALGLPGGVVADLGYTPPITIRGTRARDLLALALSRRVVERERYSLSLRAFGQSGRALGDITCPARLANAGLESNPFGCRAPSHDRIALRYYGLDATASWNAAPWRLHASAGVARMDLVTDVDALTFDVRDRSRLESRVSRPFLAVGASRDLDPRWSVGVELLHVPLRVRREPEGASERDPFTSLRLTVVRRFG